MLQLIVGGLTFVCTLCLATLGNRIWRDNPLERWIRRVRDATVSRFARKSDVEDVLQRYEFDWEAGTVKPKEFGLTPDAN